MPFKDKNAQLEYQRKWMARRRSEAITRLGGKCSKCGSTEKLEFAHKERGTKTVLYAGTHQAINWSWKPERIEAELTKCKLLCDTCHNEETALENMVPLIHGTLSGYKKDCRCEQCRAANAAYEHGRRYSMKVQAVTQDGRSTRPTSTTSCIYGLTPIPRGHNLTGQGNATRCGGDPVSIEACAGIGEW